MDIFEGKDYISDKELMRAGEADWMDKFAQRYKKTVVSQTVLTDQQKTEMVQLSLEYMQNIPSANVAMAVNSVRGGSALSVEDRRSIESMVTSEIQKQQSLANLPLVIKQAFDELSTHTAQDADAAVQNSLIFLKIPNNQANNYRQPALNGLEKYINDLKQKAGQINQAKIKDTELDIDTVLTTQYGYNTKANINEINYIKSLIGQQNLGQKQFGDIDKELGTITTGLNTGLSDAIKAFNTLKNNIDVLLKSTFAKQSVKEPNKVINQITTVEQALNGFAKSLSQYSSLFSTAQNENDILKTAGIWDDLKNKTKNWVQDKTGLGESSNIQGFQAKYQEILTGVNLINNIKNKTMLQIENLSKNQSLNPQKQAVLKQIITEFNTDVVQNALNPLCDNFHITSQSPQQAAQVIQNTQQARQNNAPNVFQNTGAPSPNPPFTFSQQGGITLPTGMMISILGGGMNGGAQQPQDVATMFRSLSQQIGSYGDATKDMVNELNALETKFIQYQESRKQQPAPAASPAGKPAMESQLEVEELDI